MIGRAGLGKEGQIKTRGINNVKLFKFLALITIFWIDSAVAKDYIFFLHNRFLEDHPIDATHPEYGNLSYNEIIGVFEESGFVVFSEKRPANTDVRAYAHKVVTQIDSLLKRGVKANHITVVGTSKGGYIAQFVSTYLANPRVNFVFIGAYLDQDLQRLPEVNFCGNILNIYEESDEYGVSALRRKQTSNLPIKHFKEINLKTGMKHGFLFKPLDEWMKPTMNWATRRYK